MRILLHPGFHKTGTSSLQSGARLLSRPLSRHLYFMDGKALGEAPSAARRFSARSGMTHLHRYGQALSDSLANLPPLAGKALLISSEDLCGALPGLRGVTAYDAAPALMDQSVTTLRARFGEEAEITIWFTTRAPEPWLRSLWYQNLRATRLTDSFADYQASMTLASKLDDVVARVAKRLDGRATVQATPIEDCGAARLGPLGAALDLLGLRTGRLPALPAQNIQPEGAAEKLLDLNRSDLDKQALAKAKRAVIAKYRRQGATRRDQT